MFVPERIKRKKLVVANILCAVNVTSFDSIVKSVNFYQQSFW